MREQKRGRGRSEPVAWFALIKSAVSKIRRHDSIRRDDTWCELIENCAAGNMGGAGTGWRVNEDAIMRPRSTKSANPAGLEILSLMDRAVHTCQYEPRGLRRLSWKRRIHSGNVLICRRSGRPVIYHRGAAPGDWIVRTLFTSRVKSRGNSQKSRSRWSHGVRENWIRRTPRVRSEFTMQQNPLFDQLIITNDDNFSANSQRAVSFAQTSGQVNRASTDSSLFSRQSRKVESFT
jgi:hypothetical protein